MTNKPRKIELLAPARDAATAFEAILHGADAVYMGAPSHGARAAATNSLTDIASVVEFAHKFNARVYITVNTLVYENELDDVRRMISDLYNIGVDALIVQDLGILEMDIPPIALHASTQCDTRDAEKARFLQDSGFSQIVLARELGLSEINRIYNSVDVPLEVFVHGALCVSYSGDCQASLLATGRSANRGECAQMCRLPYDLCDENNNVIIRGKHLLSLKDMNRLDHLESLLAAGASSLKIEGRLKDVSYVKTTVAAYRKELDRIISENPDKYERSSLGDVATTFSPNLSNVFNRGFTDYFLNDRKQSGISSFDTPKAIGEKVGKVKSARGNCIELTGCAEINNGDGLGYFNSDGSFTGFRVNRAEECKLFTLKPIDVTAGTVIYRNRNKRFDELMAGTTASRTLALDMTLRVASHNVVALDVAIDQRTVATATIEVEPTEARSPQADARRRVLSKLGDTVYRLGTLRDETGSLFIPASTLTTLRREAINVLDSSRRASYPRDYRKSAKPNLAYPGGDTIDSRGNVANSMARKFYTAAGVRMITPAMEVSKPDLSVDQQVMETRYCLRRELGACLKTKSAGKLPDRLYLVSGNNRYKLQFVCDSCLMRVIRPGQR
ncbi:MAG: U32 family peptidase [Muribaculaceae bacterium]|nr:U32 family peptidase [Muribaculaceae bacterium]